MELAGHCKTSVKWDKHGIVKSLKTGISRAL